MSYSIGVWNIDRFENLSLDLQNSMWTQLEHLGNLSGIAQQLNFPITTKEKFYASDNLIITCSLGDSIIGYIRYGVKQLYFYRKGIPECHHPSCLLDFFVLETHQRHGVGRMLFEHMLSYVGDVPPHKFAYDRPSPKLKSFMNKHYNLLHPDLQPNRFVIFEGFFS